LRRLPILEAQEVEAANFVGAVVRTVARADAAIVDHIVQAFGAVDRGTDGADLLARRVLALLAGHGLEECRRIKERLVVAGRIVGGGLHRLLVITVDADPMHFASAQDRKSTRLNSSHLVISYAVFCL